MKSISTTQNSLPKVTSSFNRFCRFFRVEHSGVITHRQNYLTGSNKCKLIIPLTDTTRHDIIANLNNGKSHRTIATKQHVSTATVSKICKPLNYILPPAKIVCPVILSETDRRKVSRLIHAKTCEYGAEVARKHL